MPWNEPGGNPNNQDPWGGGGRKSGGEQGPPDLDEALRKLQQKIRRLFGKPGAPSPQGEGSLWSVVGLIVLAAFALWGWTAVYMLDAQEQAVILRLGKYSETVGEGLHVYLPPMDRKYEENVTNERSYSDTALMLTEDENIVEVPFTIQYRINSLKDYVLNVDQPELTLRQATDSAIRHVAGSTSMDQVITDGREQMANEVEKRLQSYLDAYGAGIQVTQVNIQRATAPSEVRDAFDDVSRAREDELRSRNQAEAYANANVPQARGAAQRMIEEATGYRDEAIARAEGETNYFNQLYVEYRKAPQVMRERLYLETMQDVLKNSSKVLVPSAPGQNNMIYLPFDKWMGDARAASGASASAPLVPVTPRVEPSGRVNGDDAQGSNRTREGR